DNCDHRFTSSRGPDRFQRSGPILCAVSDETFSRLNDLKRAAEPPRYRLLRHAAAHGSIRAKDAASIALLDPTTGTAGYHLRELVKYDLLLQGSDGEYVLTPTGTRVEQVLSSFVE